MFTAAVGVEDQDEIAQDSLCMFANCQGTFSRVVDFNPIYIIVLFGGSPWQLLWYATGCHGSHHGIPR